MVDENKKLKEWYQFGKDAYKSVSRMMKNNISHPDYNTIEKREVIHDKYDESYMLKDERDYGLINQFGYTPELIKKCKAEFRKGYDASRAWYKKADEKYQKVLDKYMPIFKQAEEYAKSVDVSDIKDGFPCGSAHLYLQQYAEGEELRKAIGHFATSEGEQYKYAIPVKMPSYGQCIAFDERICSKVNEFLREKGIFCHTHSWVD